MESNTLVITSIFISAFALLLVLIQIQKKPDIIDSGNASQILANTYAILNQKIENLENQIAERDSRISELKKEIENIRNERDNTIRLLNETIDMLNDRIKQIEISAKNTKTSMHESELLRLPKALLISSDKIIRQADEIALNRARIKYKRIAEARKDDILDEFRRRRMEGKMYKYVIFSAHMSDNGIQLADGEVAEPYWLSTNLDNGIDLVILNGCNSTRIADSIIGVVNNVISISERVSNSDASSFLSAFWTKFANGSSLADSYEHAKIVNPSMATYVDIQTHGDNDTFFL